MNMSYILICLLSNLLKPFKSKMAKNLLVSQFFLMIKVNSGGWTSSLQEVDYGNTDLEQHAIRDIHYSPERLQRCPTLSMNQSYVVSAKSKSIFPTASSHAKMLATSTVVFTATITNTSSNFMHINSCKTNG